jgi:hypothetical protein
VIGKECLNDATVELIDVQVLAFQPSAHMPPAR